MLYISWLDSISVAAKRHRLANWIPFSTSHPMQVSYLVDKFTPDLREGVAQQVGMAPQVFSALPEEEQAHADPIPAQ